MKDLYQVEAGHFTAGLVVCERGWVRYAAPIIKWSKGWKIYDFARYCEKKGWKLKEIKEADDTGATDIQEAAPEGDIQSVSGQGEHDGNAPGQPDTVSDVHHSGSTDEEGTRSTGVLSQ